MRRRSPANAAHVGAACGAPRALAGLNARFKGRGWRRRAVWSRMRSRPDVVAKSSGCRCYRAASVQVVAHVGWQRAISVVLVLHAVGSGHFGTGRHGHGSVCRGRRREWGSVVGNLVALGSGGTSRCRSCHAVSGQGLGGGPCGILDRASMVILVTGQSGTASKRLLAISVWALVWPLS